jgi:chitodextrinase
MSIYYVATTGNDANAGTSTAPFKTIQKAANKAVAGDTVIVKTGTYNAGFNLYAHVGGTQGNPITFSAESGVTITHCGTVGTNAWLAGINIESTPGWFIIDGFKIKSDGSMQRAGIRSAYSNNNIFRNCDISSAFIGIFTSSGSGLLLENNKCHNSTDQHGIYLGAGTKNSVVRGNECYSNNWDGIHMNASNAAGPNDSNTIEGNKLYNNNLSGMDIEGVTNATFRNNIIYNNGKHGMSFHSQDQTRAGYPTAPCSGNTIVNNSIVGNGLFGLCFQPEDTANTKIYNNILLNSSAIYGSIGTNAIPSFTSDYNVVVDNFSTNLGVNKITLAQWIANTGQDTHSIISSGSQLFVNPTTYDYHLKNGSPAINIGTVNSYTPSNDFEGKTRPQGTSVDIGAFEFAEAVVVPPPDTTAPIISNVTVSNVTETSAVVSWNTNEASTTQLSYGLDTQYGSSTSIDNAYVTTHSVTLTGLIGGTTYHLQAKSVDAAGNVGVSNDVIVVTLTPPPPPDTTAPTISNIVVSNITETSAVVSWLTDEPSNTQLSYGLNTNYELSEPTDNSYVTSHTVSIDGLNPATTYHVKLKSADSAGNEGISNDVTIVTLTPPPPPEPTVITVNGLANISATFDGTKLTLYINNVKIAESN